MMWTAARAFAIASVWSVKSAEDGSVDLTVDETVAAFGLPDAVHAAQANANTSAVATIRLIRVFVMTSLNRGETLPLGPSRT
jgi:hypothetical protein